MTLSTRLTAATIGLVLLTGSALELLIDRHVEASTLVAGLTAVSGILILTAPLAHSLTRPLTRPLTRMADAVEAYIHDASTLTPISATGKIGILAHAFDRMATEICKQSAKLNHASNKRRNSQAALEQYAGRDRMFVAAVESASYPMVTKTLDGRITAWNPAAVRLYKYTAAEAIGNNIEIIIPSDRRDEYLAVLDKALKEEPIENYETIRVDKDGRRIDVSLSAWPVKSSSGNSVGVATIARDITTQKFVEQKFRLAVESCPSSMVMTDRSGKLVTVSTEIERLFGYGRDELIGQSVDILLPERFRSQHLRHRGEFRSETCRMGAGRDLFGLRKDGTEFPIEVGLNPIRVDHGLLVLGVIVDITERKRLERLKDEFVASVSHELRTPLTSISGSLGLLVGNAAGRLPDSAARLLSIAHANSQRLVRLVNDILDIEKMESGQVVFNFRRVEVRSLVEQVIEANRGFAEAYGVRVRLENACAAGDVRADPDRLAQVVTNLLSNAIKFTPAQNEVVVAIEKGAEFVRISVRDHGPGISVGFKPHIFERFAQADATSAQRKGGTGLGLSIVKQIVDRLGGEVGFADAPGGGTIFHVALPCWQHVAGMAIDLDAQPDALRILLCEDDPDTAVALREQLSQFDRGSDATVKVSEVAAAMVGRTAC